MNPEFVVPVAMFACVFGILYVYFTTRNRERMAMIEKGADGEFHGVKIRVLEDFLQKNSKVQWRAIPVQMIIMSFF